MASRHVDIDPDGDTLIILPRITAEGDDKNEPSQVTFKTSMKHLTLASIRAKKFDPMFDPDAFEIVLRIVHAQLHKLPKELSLATMAQVAIIADDLQCSDPIAHFAQQWGSNNDFCYGIPVPQQILKAIEEKRTILMKEQLKYLFTVERELQDETLCWECRAQNFGFLKYNLLLHQLPASESSELWANITCQVLKEKMQKFKYATRTGCQFKSGLKHPSFKKQITEALKVSNAGLDPASFLNTSAAAK
ncbi:hypothetical protein THAR02_09277 [Trichoderma harzianum]|uniref:BTB domain-containing protein n=1 Tax=Trichoderma harzianum TaxID=5544 RepID=A0A0F9XD88_TRIHA|nr:hypothetical protein THAR02_09277 [Trichoderma harzianum]